MALENIYSGIRSLALFYVFVKHALEWHTDEVLKILLTRLKNVSFEQKVQQ